MIGNIVLALLALVTLYQIILSLRSNTKSASEQRKFMYATVAVFLLLLFLLLMRLF